MIPLGIPTRIMKYSVANPSPPLPPTAPTPSPCVYTPHHLKYADAHSGTTLARPWRANSRTSLNASQGFFSRFRRSIFCALVSFAGAAVSIIWFPCVENKKPALDVIYAGFFVNFGTVVFAGIIHSKVRHVQDNTRNKSPEWRNGTLHKA